MARPEKPITITNVDHAALVAALREIRRAAGKPSYRALADLPDVHYSDAALRSAAAGDAARVGPWELIETYVRACGADPIHVYPLWKCARIVCAPPRASRVQVARMEYRLKLPLAQGNGRLLPAEPPAGESPGRPRPRASGTLPAPGDRGRKPGGVVSGVAFLIIMVLAVLISSSVVRGDASTNPAPSSTVGSAPGQPLVPGARVDLIAGKVTLVATSSGVSVDNPTGELESSPRSLSFTLTSCRNTDDAVSTELDLAKLDHSKRGWISFRLLSQDSGDVVFSVYDVDAPLARIYFPSGRAEREARVDIQTLASDSIRLELGRVLSAPGGGCAPVIMTVSDMRVGP